MADLKRKADRPPDEFSNTVRRRLEKSSRTGQACDRCKVRKIRCDATPGGCTPCRQNNTECKTIDRITGRATARGHQDRLEDENRILRQKCAEYAEQLRDVGVEVAPIELPPLYQAPAHQNWNASVTPWADSIQNGHPPSLHNPISSLFSQTLPTVRNSAPGDNYLGLSSNNSTLSPITGTSMHFFGMKIDVADFAPNDVEDADSPASYKYFISTVLRQRNDPVIQHEPPLPAGEAEMKLFANLYFRTLNPFTPILHRPSFMYLISRVYNDPLFKPSKAERVMMHMVLAQLKSQLGLRNDDQVASADSARHYTWSLSQYYQLLLHYKLEDVQAMALIAIHLRTFSKPDAALAMIRKSLDMALELGLHRSAKAWNEESKMDAVELELRKRVFWTIFALHIHICGKLGRPMPLRMEDIDVEFPEPVNDNLPNEPPRCSFLVGIECVKVCALMGQMYGTVYAVRRDPSMHETVVNRLEDLHREWRNSVPPQLTDPSRHSDEMRVFALYVQFWEAEFQLHLHHPAVCLSPNSEWATQDANVSLMAADNMLRVVEQLRQLNALDLPLINVSIYLAAMFTTLFVQTNRMESISQIEMEKLRRDMAIWLEIMGAIGAKLGSGSRLQDTIRPLVDKSLRSISHRLNVSKPQASKSIEQTTAAMVAAAIAKEANRVSQEQEQAQQGNNPTSSSYDGSYTGYGDQGHSADAKSQRQSSYVQAHDMDPANPYSTTSQNAYAYPDPSVAANSNPTYGDTHGASAAVHAFAAEQGYIPASAAAQGVTPDSHAATAVMGGAQQGSDQRPPSSYDLYQTTTQAQQLPTGQQNQAAAATASAAMYNMSDVNSVAAQPQNDWLRWAQTNFQNLQGKDYLSGANTLMTLRGTDGPAVPARGSESRQPQQGQWPMMMFDVGTGANGINGSGVED